MPARSQLPFPSGRVGGPSPAKRGLLLVVIVGLLMSMAIGSGQGASPDAAVPERYTTTSLSTDYPDGDYQSFFDVSLVRCHAACLGDENCAGFTFDQRNNACFLKEALSEPVYTLDAVGGVIKSKTEAQLTQAQEAAEALGFLGTDVVNGAREQAETIAVSYAAGEFSESEWRGAAERRLADGEVAEAVASSGAAVTVADSGAAWLLHARALAAQAELDGNRSFGAYQRSSYAALNAALRLPTAERPEALLVLATALEETFRGTAALATMQYADRLQPGIAPDELLRLRETFGFRVLSHDVDALSAAPRICVFFSEELAATGDYDQFVQRATDGLAVEVEGAQLCLSGVSYGENYSLTLRAGLPSVSGETLARDVPLDVYVRDRVPSVSFPGRAYVLPAHGPRSLPVETVNANRLELRLLRVSDRNVVASIRDGTFTQALSAWQGEQFEELLTELLWTGEAHLEGALNRATPSLLPLDEVGELEPGVYVLRAAVYGADSYDVPPATQWFLVSDLGLTSLAGDDGMHVVVQRLSDAQPVEGLNVQLVARSNRVLAEATTDTQGHVLFAPALSQGSGNSAPAMLLVEGDNDLIVMSLEEPEFDLSDRGVEGRVQAEALDVFLTPDRGAYRPGETINLTILVRDAKAAAIEGLPLTVRLLRPDGVEYSKVVTGDDLAGGYVVSLPLGSDVPRGPWRVETYVDPDAPALASRSVLVEDFLPERVDFEPTLSATGPLDTTAPPDLELEARYLFGAPAAGLSLTGEVTVTTSETLPGWNGYRFGRFDQRVDAQFRAFPAGLRTDTDGRLVAPLPLDDLELAARPYQVSVVATLVDGASRPVERTLTRALRPTAPVVGIRPAFDGSLSENSGAGFELVLVDPDGEAIAGALHWQVDRVETRYQWYAVNGRWYWEPVTERQRIGDGVLETQGEPVHLDVPVAWGRYELRVTHEGGTGSAAAAGSSRAGAPASASMSFTAGWASADTSRETPDLLELSLDAEEYRPGDTARLRIVPESPGTALVSVLADSVVDLQLVEVDGETTIELPVTDEWGTGVYVTASLIRGSDVPSQLPTRSLGLAHAAVDPGERALEVVLDAPEQVRSGESLEVVLEVPDAGGEQLFATIAAVDLGVLNLTGFEAPDPSAHYFGQRALGVAIRDLYGRLIDARNGAMGEIRSGGDAAEFMEAGPAPAEDLLALFSGPLELVDGRAEFTFDLPPFDGTVRLMAVVWSDDALGQAAADVIARDPVVLQASLPRFLTPGDESRLRVEVTHVDGPAGTMNFEAEGHGLGSAPNSLDLEQGGRAVIDLPLRPTAVGEHVYRLALTTPDGELIERELRLSVQHTDPATARTTRLELEPGETFLLDDTALAGYVRATTSVTLAAGPGAALDLPGLILRLVDYPYTCTEQLASGLQPLLYAPRTVERLGLLSGSEIDEAVQQRVDRILTRQGRIGSFGLWSAGGFDLWLDSYATDLLLSAEAAGAQVPATALQQALDNLRNEVAGAGQMNDGAPGYAYAFYVLARAGEAAIGDLRYYTDALSERFDTPLAAAHMAAALAAYGERGRAEALFAQAYQLALEENDGGGWRDDYGTVLRDRAGLLALAAAADSQVVDFERLTALLLRDGPVDHLSPQEAAWLLRAAVELSESAEGLTLGGEPVVGDVFHRYDGAPTELRNDGDETVTVTLTTMGVPVQAPAAGGNGYSISRSFYTPSGEPTDLSDVHVGDRLVVVLEVTPDRGVPGGRLMIDDALAAGLEIDNANLLRAGDVRALDWLTLTWGVEASEARADRFLAAVNWTAEEPLRLAYIVRAVSDGTFHYPAPLVEDLYRPTLRAVGETGSLTVRR